MPLIPASIKAVMISLFHIKHRDYLQIFHGSRNDIFSHVSVVCCLYICPSIKKTIIILIKYLYMYWLKEYTARKSLKEFRDLRPFGAKFAAQKLTK